ncbi:ABC transporter permease [Leucobacter albus]|uniref:ABC transporter permease n=1 Tax=Leucobacter albus TaxID=272210 RepID=A0ABW3TSB1_9MICO
MNAIIRKEFRELARDRRTLAMLVALPVLLLIIFGYAANFSVDRVTAIVVGPQAEAVAAELAEYSAARDDLDILEIDSALTELDAEQLLRDQVANAVIVSKPPTGGAAADTPFIDRISVYLDGSGLFVAQASQAVFATLAAEDLETQVTQRTDALADTLAETLSQALAEARATGAPPTITPPTIDAPTFDPDSLVTVLFNPDLETSWVMVPGLIGLILLFIGALITSIGLVRERETGTLEQLAVMPISPSAIIFGKITPYFALALIDMAVITLLGAWLFDVPFNGSVLLFSLAALIFLFVVLGIGVLISTLSQNTGQAIQMAILFVVPQVLLSGLIFPLTSMPLGVRWLGYALPLTWFREVTQGVMLRGAGFEALWLPLVVLLGMAVIAFGLATTRMRHSLTHGGTR